MAYQKTILGNGIRVVTENHRHSRAATVGVWVETGTRDETDSERGLSHFLEHMVFKGTENRNAYRIARDLEAVGGELNAYTTQEYTCYHATSLKEDLALQVDVLCDLVTHAEFSTKEFSREKSVVVQEIAMVEDQPEELIFDVFFDVIFGKHRLGKPILGQAESVEGFRKSDLLKYYKTRYTNKNIIVSAAGAVDHESFVGLVEKYLGSLKRKYDPRRRTRPEFVPVRKAIHKDSEQVHLVVGTPAASFRDEGRFEAFILNCLLGGGMTSRLYQSVREKRGLVYSIYSQLTTFTDTGVLSIYAGTDVSSYKTVLKLIRAEFDRLRTKKVSESDLRLFKTQVRGGILLGADDVENRMASLGVNEMVFGEYRAVDDIIEDIERVNVRSLKSYVDEYLDLATRAVVMVGGVEPAEAADVLASF